MASLISCADLGGGVLDRDDLIGLAVQQQRRHVELRQVVGEVSLGERLDAVVGVELADLHAPEPELIQQPLRHVGIWLVRAVERQRQFLVELGAVTGHPGAQPVEDLHRQPVRVRVGLQHQRRNSGDEDSLGDPARSVSADVAGDLPAAGGVPDQSGVGEIECVDHRGQVVGVTVHVVTARGLTGTAVTAPVVGNDTEAVLS